MATPVPCQKATCPAGATCVAGTDNACTVTGGSSTDCTNQTGLTCAPGMYKVSKYTSASNGAKGPTCELSCQECGCVAAAPSPPPSSFAARLGDAPAAGTCIPDEGGAMVCTTSVTDQKMHRRSYRYIVPVRRFWWSVDLGRCAKGVLYLVSRVLRMQRYRR